MRPPAIGSLRIIRRVLLASTTALALGSCGEPVEPRRTATAGASFALGPYRTEAVIQVAHIVEPAVTSDSTEIDWVPTLNPVTNRHYAWLPARHVPQPRLFVVMPGTNNRPVDYRLFSAEAARAGYHVIGLMYQNDRGVDALCKGDSDPGCAEKARMEVLTGTDHSSKLTVTPGNSIDHRLARLLAYLSREYPEQKWHRFLHQGQPDWSKIAVSGQSQGAGQAALIARERLVPRVVMLSGPPDQANPPAVDAWVHMRETPADSYYALYHVKDNFIRGIAANMGPAGFDLDRLGVAGVGTAGPWCDGTVLPDVADTRFDGTHVLVTNLVPAVPGTAPGSLQNCLAPGPHRSTARDDFTPMLADGKTPALLGAWRYMIGEPEQGIPLHASDGGDGV